MNVPPVTATTTTATTDTAVEDEVAIASAIKNSPYRVIKVFESDTYKHTIFVATKRAGTECGSKDRPARCDDDTSCGSRYSVPTCYFFTEPKYEFGAAPTTEYIGSLSQMGVLQLDSLEMKDDRYLYFSTFEGDAGSGFNADYQLDLQTKQFKLLKKTEFHEEV